VLLLEQLMLNRLPLLVL
jgi:hypothetical protein